MQVQIPCVYPHAQSIKCRHSELFHQCMFPHKHTLLYKFGAPGKGSYLSKKIKFNILFNLLHSYLKLLFGELMELFQESFSCQLILWAIWKLQQYRFLRNFKRTRWYNVLIFLVLCLIRLLLVVSDDTIRKRWGVTCVIKFLLNQHLFFVEACSYIRSTLHISPWMAFS